jgi:phospholipid/cholesterol/gamma-HCH transport system ATP-binding protein
MWRESIDQIEFCNVSFQNARGADVFQGLNLKLPQQGVVWVKGEGGAGKSVFIKMICGLISPSVGHIQINEKSIDEMTFEEFLPLRCNMGYSFDFGGLINNRDIQSNLMLPSIYHQYTFQESGGLAARVSRYLDIFGLKEVVGERPSAIVGRLRKAASVARAFVHAPQILLLDDPSTGLRNDTKKNLIEHIKSEIAAQKIKAVFIASDDEAFMSQFDAHVIELKNHQVFLSEMRQAA